MSFISPTLFLSYIEDYTTLTLLRSNRSTGVVDDYSWTGVVLPRSLLRRLIHNHGERDVIQSVQ